MLILGHTCRRSKSLCYIFIVCTLCFFFLLLSSSFPTPCLFLPLDPLAAAAARSSLGLIAVLLFLLLELSEMGLNGGGRLLHFDGAQRRGGWHVWHGADPVADVGV